MLFAHPNLLWLLILAPASAWSGWRAARRRPALVAAFRAACVATLVLALARPMLAVRGRRPIEVLVVDVGPTMPADVMRRASTILRGLPPDATVVAFSNRARRIADVATLADAAAFTALRTNLARPLASDDLAAGGSALADALRLAGAQVPPDGRGRITLLSNGLATRGDAEAEAYRLAGRGIPVHVEGAAIADGAPAIVINALTVPPQARVGQSIVADVLVESRVNGTAHVTVTPPDGHAVSVDAPVSSGVQAVPVTLPTGTAGLMPLSATAVLNDRAAPPFAAAVHVGASVRVLLVRDVADPSTERAIRNLLGTSAAIDAIVPADVGPASIAGANVIVLADVPADELSADAQRAIRQAVHDGTGLLLTGAARSFGPGGYDDSALASILPVRMPQQMESIDPSVTLVLIIDTSGSMGEFNRLNLAKEVARLAISHLKPHDKVGIVEFYGGKRWAVPIQSAANVAVVNRALARLSVGGLTTLYPAVEEAAFAMRSVQTRGKHVLILSDGGVEPAPFAAVLRPMAEDGVAVSSVAIAPDPNEPNMMPDLARWGGGRYYSVPDQFALADITLKQPQLSLLTPVVHEPARLTGVGDDSLVRAADVSRWPAVAGYVRTRAKPTADVLVTAGDGDPLLVRWRVGAGFVAALPTQLGSAMTRGLEDEPAFAAMFAGLIRQIGAPHADRLVIVPRVRAAGVEVDVVAADADPTIADGTLKLTLADARGATIRTLVAEPTVAGRWNLLLPGLAAGAYEVRADVAGAHGTAAVAVNAPRDWPRLTPDRGLLDRIAAFATLASDRAAMLPASTATFIELRNAAAALAIAFLVLNVAARRWPARTKRVSE